MFLTKINIIMEIFLKKLFSKIKRETKEGRGLAEKERELLTLVFLIPGGHVHPRTWRL